MAKFSDRERTNNYFGGNAAIFASVKAHGFLHTRARRKRGQTNATSPPRAAAGAALTFKAQRLIVTPLRKRNGLDAKTSSEVGESKVPDDHRHQCGDEVRDRRFNILPDILAQDPRAIRRNLFSHG
ncbi:hypothetical protein EVAR_44696_1 [Eumeta japonica]|uniref:Uncharacterized protein n=1 Tax=Eumeta variegata TaxID=151549 RepID=A0A4C1XFX1_EUMVA|nr:hypothetical protein EVAR_44696_1 [Eumeta japonica]